MKVYVVMYYFDGASEIQDIYFNKYDAISHEKELNDLIEQCYQNVEFIPQVVILEFEVK